MVSSLDFRVHLIAQCRLVLHSSVHLGAGASRLCVPRCKVHQGAAHLPCTKVQVHRDRPSGTCTSSAAAAPCVLLFSVSSRSLPSSSVAKIASISLDRATKALRERTQRNTIRFCRRVKTWLGCRWCREGTLHFPAACHSHQAAPGVGIPGRPTSADV